jgi:hypothetical protein
VVETTGSKRSSEYQSTPFGEYSSRTVSTADVDEPVNCVRRSAESIARFVPVCVFHVTVDVAAVPAVKKTADVVAVPLFVAGEDAKNDADASTRGESMNTTDARTSAMTNAMNAFLSLFVMVICE